MHQPFQRACELSFDNDEAHSVCKLIRCSFESSASAVDDDSEISYKPLLILSDDFINRYSATARVSGLPTPIPLLEIWLTTTYSASSGMYYYGRLNSGSLLNYEDVIGQTFPRLIRGSLLPECRMISCETYWTSTIQIYIAADIELITDVADVVRYLSYLHRLLNIDRKLVTFATLWAPSSRS